jgi:hypothetical protein
MIMSFLVGLSCIEKGRIVGHIHIQGAQLELKIYTVWLKMQWAIT